MDQNVKTPTPETVPGTMAELVPPQNTTPPAATKAAESAVQTLMSETTGTTPAPPSGSKTLTFAEDDLEKLAAAMLAALTTGSGSFTSDTPPPVNFSVAGHAVTIQSAAPALTITVSPPLSL